MTHPLDRQESQKEGLAPEGVMTLTLHDIGDITDAPERAALTILDVALVMVEHALCAEHPTARPRFLSWGESSASTPVLDAAKDVLSGARTLRRQLQRYEHAVAEALEPSPADYAKVLPF